MYIAGINLRDDDWLHHFSFDLCFCLIWMLAQGPSILHCNKQKTGLVQRVVDELFQSLQSSESMAMWSVKLSMVKIPASCSEFEPTSLNLYSHWYTTSQVEIYLEKVRSVLLRIFSYASAVQIHMLEIEYQTLFCHTSGIFLTCPRTTYKSKRVKLKGSTFLEQQK